jgi:inhibitor of cysteine peptidase
MNLKSILFILLVLLLVGCSRPSAQIDTVTELPKVEDIKSENPTSKEKPVSVKPQISNPKQEENQVTPPSQSKPEQLAMIDSVEVLILESFPVQYNAIIQGNFRNGCESIDTVSQITANQKITVLVGTKSTGEFCTQALVPFSETITLNTKDLIQGQVTLEVNGLISTFNIQ